MTAARTRRDPTPTPRRKGARGEKSGKPQTSRKRTPPKRTKTQPAIWVWTRRALIALTTLGVLGVIGLASAFWYFGRDLPSVGSLRDHGKR